VADAGVPAGVSAGFPAALAASLIGHVAWAATLSPEPPDVERRVLRDPVPVVLVASLEAPITVSVRPATPPPAPAGEALAEVLRRGSAGTSAGTSAAARRPPRPEPRAAQVEPAQPRARPPRPAPARARPPRARPAKPVAAQAADSPGPVAAEPPREASSPVSPDDPPESPASPGEQTEEALGAEPGAAEPGVAASADDGEGEGPGEGEVGDGGDAAGGDGPFGRGEALTAYLAELSRRAHAAVRYPRAARRLGLSGEVLVACTVDARGRVIAASVARSSGVEALDAAAVAAVRGLALSPPDAGLLTALERVRVPVRFSPGRE